MKNGHDARGYDLASGSLAPERREYGVRGCVEGAEAEVVGLERRYARAYGCHIVSEHVKWSKEKRNMSVSSPRSVGTMIIGRSL
jgi:hypothetical protein